MQNTGAKITYFEIIIYLLLIVLLLMALLIGYQVIEINKDNDIYRLTFWFNLYYIALSFFYITKLHFKADTLITFSNNFLLFPITRFKLFQNEYKKLAGNIPIILLSGLAFYLIVIFHLTIDSATQILRLLIIFSLQFHALHWFFLYFKNIFHQNKTNLLSVFLFIQVLNSMAQALHQPLFLLNPLTGWLMIPEIFQFNLSLFLLFIVSAIGVFFVSYKLASKHVKWHT